MRKLIVLPDGQEVITDNGIEVSQLGGANQAEYDLSTLSNEAFMAFKGNPGKLNKKKLIRIDKNI